MVFSPLFEWNISETRDAKNGAGLGFCMGQNPTRIFLVTVEFSAPNVAFQLSINNP